VQDSNILSRVPDALYIGQKGTITSTRNRGGETQEYWLAGDAARAFAKAQEILAAKGKQIIVEGKNGAGRTVDTQTEIYNRSRGGRGFAAGKPTSSNHTRGNAMDVANYTDPDVKRALLAVGWRQGDSRGPIANDLHHFSFAGTSQSQDQRRPNRRR
jgi:D-alanyl-D-alanine dipeptidase